MPLRDYLPFLGRSRTFATVGSNPTYSKDNPRSFGAGVIKRIKLQKSGRGGGYGGGADKEPQVGDYRTYMNVYLSDPIIRTLIDLPCIYAAKDGYDIVTDDEVEREAITNFFDEINLDQLIYSWLRNGRIFGTSYLEYTGDNLVLRSSQNMYVQRDENGQIKYYYQDVGDDKENVRFEEDEIIEFKNNAFDDYAYGLSDIHPLLYLVDLKDYAERDIGAALNKYASSRFDISAVYPTCLMAQTKLMKLLMHSTH